MMKAVFYSLLLIVFVLVSFFGLGPVLLADGSPGERMMTLFLVIVIYSLLGWAVYRVKKHDRK